MNSAHLVLLDGTYLWGILHLVPLHRDDLLALVLAEPDQPRVVAVLSERVLRLSPAKCAMVESGRRRQNYSPYSQIRISLDFSSHFDFDILRHFLAQALNRLSQLFCKLIRHS